VGSRNPYGTASDRKIKEKRLIRDLFVKRVLVVAVKIPLFFKGQVSVLSAYGTTVKLVDLFKYTFLEKAIL